MKAFMSQFGYCPLVWMLYRKKINNKINKIHERALRLAFDDFESTFDELLIRDKSVCVRYKSLKVMFTELSKLKNRQRFTLLKQFSGKEKVGIILG